MTPTRGDSAALGRSRPRPRNRMGRRRRPVPAGRRRAACPSRAIPIASLRLCGRVPAWHGADAARGGAGAPARGRDHRLRRRVHRRRPRARGGRARGGRRRRASSSPARCRTTSCRRPSRPLTSAWRRSTRRGMRRCGSASTGRRSRSSSTWPPGLPVVAPALPRLQQLVEHGREVCSTIRTIPAALDRALVALADPASGGAGRGRSRSRRPRLQLGGALRGARRRGCGRWSGSMSAPLRVLLVTDAFPPVCGGSGWSTWELARGLVARGHHVEVVKIELGTDPGLTRPSTSRSASRRFAARHRTCRSCGTSSRTSGCGRALTESCGRRLRRNRSTSSTRNT